MVRCYCSARNYDTGTVIHDFGMISKYIRSWLETSSCDYNDKCSSNCLAHFNNWTSTWPYCDGYQGNVIASIDISDCGDQFIGDIAKQCNRKSTV